jgi:hypothetical protein
MNRTAVVFYLALSLMLLGFGLAGPTAGAPGAVLTGWLGLFATIAATVARIEAEQRATGPAATSRAWTGAEAQR